MSIISELYVVYHFEDCTDSSEVQHIDAYQSIARSIEVSRKPGCVHLSNIWSMGLDEDEECPDEFSNKDTVYCF